MAKYKGFYLYFDQRPLLELVPAKEFKNFVLGVMEYAENGTQPQPLKSAQGNNIQESFLLNLDRSRVNAANGKKGAEVTNNAYGGREKKKTADGETDETADGLKRKESNKREHNITITKESVTEHPLQQEHRHEYGIYKNVLLTDEEKASLELDHGIPLAYIDHFSTSLKTKGYKIQSHYATILQWWEEDKSSSRWQAENKHQRGSFDTDDFFESAVRRSLGDDYDNWSDITNPND